MDVRAVPLLVWIWVIIVSTRELPVPADSCSRMICVSQSRGQGHFCTSRSLQCALRKLSVRELLLSVYVLFCHFLVSQSRRKCLFPVTLWKCPHLLNTELHGEDVT